MRIKEARVAGRLWRDRLGLQEWSLHIAWGRQVPSEPDPHKGEMCTGCEGNAWWMPEETKVLILLDKKEANESTVLHELLHVRLEGHRSCPVKYDPMYERAINSLTDALMKTWADE